ncbi:hypothetical protein ACFE04_022185 [Oxalis oulophora]
MSREDNITFISTPITVSSSDPLESHFGSNSGSYQNDNFLSNGGGGESCSGDAAAFGFTRADFRLSRLAGTVEYYERHVFLCYKNPSVWPTRIEASEFDRLPRLLSAAVSARKNHMKKETRLTICEGHDGTETSNGDVLIFPDMIRYRRLTHFDVDTFVEEVLVKEGEWLPGTPEALKGSYVFVCSHGSRDRRCGVCGPPLVNKFREEIELRSLCDKVSVRPCSHVGGHKYAGNVLIFGSNVTGEVTGHWYGYVTPDDVTTLLEQHIGKGQIVDWLWRGQMSLSEEEQKTAQELRLQLNGQVNVEKPTEELTKVKSNGGKIAVNGCKVDKVEIMGCCQGNGTSCCQNPLLLLDMDTLDTDEGMVKMTEKKKSNKNKGSGSTRKACMNSWFDSWEREDTYAALAVFCAAASVAIAYSCYKQSK